MRTLITTALTLAILGMTGAGSARAEYADVSSGGTLADAASTPISIGADGRYVLFSSTASNLVVSPPAGTQGYLRDRVAGTTSIPVPDYLPVAMTPDGRFLLVSKNGLFVFDRQSSMLERVDVSTAGLPGSAAGSATATSISADGRYVVFSSTASNLISGDGNGARDVFLRDRQLGTTTLLSSATDGSAGSGDSTGASISYDGSVVSFTSEAEDLVSGDANGDADVFARPLGGATELVSVDSAGLQGASAPPTQCAQSTLSASGRFVAFSCGAPNLAPPGLDDGQRTDHAYVRDRLAGTTVRADVDASGAVLSANGQLLSPTLTGDGRRAAFWANAAFPGRIVLWDAVPSGRANVLAVHGQAPLLSRDGLVLAYQDIPTAASTAHVGILPLSAPVADAEAPTVACSPPDGAWHAADVSLACTASDAGSGLADGAAASFALSTSVPPGVEDPAATTASRLVCDLAGNCTTAGPLGPVRVDRRSPSIACDGVPATGTHLEVNVVVRCAASDGGAGLRAMTEGLVLRTTVGGGLVDPAATTLGQSVCDLVGNCTAVGPFGPFSIDRLAAPPDERDSDGDGVDDDADLCPLTVGPCESTATVQDPAKSERAASVRAAAGAALATCAAPGRPSAIGSVASAASKKVGAPARAAILALARATCSASLTAAAASLHDQAPTRGAQSAGDLSPYLPVAHDVRADVERNLARCRRPACRAIVGAAAEAAQSTSQVSADALALAVARRRLGQARATGDRRANAAQAALVRTSEGNLAAAQDTRAAAYRRFGKVTSGAGVPTTLPPGPQASTERALTKGTGVPGQVRKDLQSAGIAPTDVTVAIVQAHLDAQQQSVVTATARRPPTTSRDRIASGLAYDAVARVVIVLAARRELTFDAMGRLLNALDDAREACSPAGRDAGLRAFASAARGTRAAAFVTTSVELLRANTAVGPRCG